MPASPKQRPMIYEGREKKTPQAFKSLLQDQGVCAKISGAWPQIRLIIIEIQSNLAGFTTANAVEAGPTVLACNAILKQFEVFHDQAVSDKHFRESHEKDTPKN